MPLWGKTDANVSKPKFGAQNTKFFVSLEESQVAANKAHGLGTPGWYDVVTYVDAQGQTRYKTELLVPMKVTQAAAGDSDIPTVGDDATVPDA